MIITGNVRILYFFKEYNTPMFQWQRVHIFDDLEHHGWKIDTVNPLDYETTEQANEALIKAAKEENYQFFFTTCTSKDLYIDTIQELKRIGLATILFCPDNVLVPYNHKEICRFFDIVWLSAMENADLFKKWRAKIVFAPYAGNPNQKPEIGKIENSVVWIGTMYGTRGKLINELIYNQVSVTAFSSFRYGHLIKHNIEIEHKDYWRFFCNYTTKTGLICAYASILNRLGKSSVLKPNGFLTINDRLLFEQIPTTYANHALALSSCFLKHTGVLKQPLYVVNLRSFEIPMACGLQFCYYNPELANYFEEGKEIVFYRDIHEMKEKADFYLNPKNERVVREMKISARKRAENEHTWYKRFQTVISAI